MQKGLEAASQDLEARLPFEPEMILVAAGEFLMGSGSEKDPEPNAWERPQHGLYLPDYRIARTPITNAQYAAFLQDTGHRRPKRWRSNKPARGKEDYPVVYVSWHDAVAYCRWLSETAGRIYRLPTEAEWEKGARGTDGRLYPWGGGWEVGRCNTAESGENGITPVAAFPAGASPCGLLDMAGNVWEWTASLWGSDWFEPAFAYPYDPNDGRENLEASDEVCRVMRGGSFAYSADLARCACRHRNFPQSYSDGIGFRVVSA